MTDIVEIALKRFEQAQEAYSTQRKEAREDLAFIAGDQQLNNVDNDFQLKNNMLKPFLRQITAEARTANPSIKVIPVSDGADQDIAEVYSGLIRHVEQMSEASEAYQTSLWYAAASGEGYIVLDTEYCSPDSFDQQLVIRSVPNPETVFLDPTMKKIDGCDADWGFIIEDISREAFEAQFPNSDITKIGDGWSKLSLPGDWVSKDVVRIANYWTKERTKKVIYQVLDPVTGETAVSDEAPDDTKILLNKRTSYDQVIRKYVITCVEVLEETTWPGSMIPIVKVTGDTFYVGGAVYQSGAVRDAKDSQRLFNFMLSRQAEMIDQAPKNSWVVVDESIDSFRDQWANANRINYGYLPFTHKDGQPGPTRQGGIDMASFSAVSQGLNQALENMKLAFGLGDASLGRQGNELSGAAINARVEQASRSTYQFFDNFLTSLKCLGRQFVEVVPYFYDTERTVRIVKPTTEEQLVAINSITNNFRYDLSKGQYDVTVTTGPAYASKRQEAYDALSAVAQSNPAASALIGDLIASQIDSPVAQKAAARLKSMVPKEALAASGDDNQSDLAPKELVMKLQADLAKAMKELEVTELEKQELEVRVKIAEDESQLKMLEMKVESEHKEASLAHQQDVALVEAKIKMKELELAERKLALQEMQLQIHAAQAAAGVAEKMKSVGSLSSIETNSGDADIGGSLN